MSKKKVAKFGLTAAAAVTTVVAANPAGAAAASSVEQAVVQASTNAKALTKFYGNTDLTVSAEFTAAFNSAKKSIANAKAQVAAFSGKEKAYYEATLAQATELQTYAARYIDAVNILSGELADATEALQADVEAGEITAEVVENYNTLSAAIKKAERTIGKVRGEAVREAFKADFLLDAKLARESVIYEVSQFNLLTQINANIAAGNTANVEADLAKLDRLKERAVEIKEAGKALYPDRTDVYPALPEIEAQLRTTEAATVVAYEETLAPAVKSVSAINAKQVKITFNKVVDKDTAEALASYQVQRNSDNAVKALSDSAFDNTGVDAFTAELQEDGKSVVITTVEAETVEAALSIQAGTAFNFVVDGVKTTDGKAFPKSTTEIVVKDEVSPELVSVSSKASTVTKNVTLTFSEPVAYSTTGVFKVAGKTVTPTAGSNPYEVVLQTTDNLTAGQSYEVEVLNLKDYAGNLVKANPTKTTVTVQSDTNAATITSVEALEDDKVKVVFDKSMNISTLSSNTVTVLNSNGVATGSYTVNRVEGTSNKEFTIDFSSGLYATSNTENLSFVFTNAIKDSSGNAIAATTKTATLTKDTVAPKVLSTTVLAKGATYDGTTHQNGALVVTFDEKVKDPGNAIAGTITLIDQDGKDITGEVTLGAPSLNSKDSKVLVIPFTANTIATTSKTATVIVSEGITTDASLGNNKNTAATLNGVNLHATLSDTQKPVVANVGNSNNDITFTVTEANLDKATVQNVDNYRLDGKPLPAGSYVVIATNAQDSTLHAVTVKLPASSVDASRNNYAFTITGIKDQAGNVADVVAVNNLSLTDDVKPVLNSGKLNSDGTITLGYSEAVTGTLTADLVVTLNGKELATTAVSPANITTGADAGGTLLQIAVTHDAGLQATGDEKIFINVAGGSNGAGYDAGHDILLAEGTFVDAAAYNGGYIKAADVLTLKVATAATGTLTGADAASNPLANNKSVTIK
ncbi:Ig-like domain-containing protein [Metabacillus litoralis]|uniref:Ig-like domain-containing protein n=1 Tax=Metabacillus litoralis TaxID=152268 RepID=UPI000EF56EB4|nr:Ig-like domain-containing protein [Metabacillus litoralis]